MAMFVSSCVCWEAARKKGKEKREEDRETGRARERGGRQQSEERRNKKWTVEGNGIKMQQMQIGWDDKMLF